MPEHLLLVVILGGTAGAALITLLLNLILSRHARLQEDIAAQLAEKTHRLEEQTDALEVERAYLEELFANAPEGVVVVDTDDRIARINPEFTRLFGYTVEDAVGRTLRELIVPEDLRDEALGITRRAAIGERQSLETRRRRKDGVEVPVSVLGAPVRVRESQVAVYGIYRDISDKKAVEAALERMATTDELTGLDNRRGFFALAERERKLARRAGRDLLLVFADLDDFKAVNDAHGHRGRGPPHVRPETRPRVFRTLSRPPADGKPFGGLSVKVGHRPRSTKILDCDTPAVPVSR